MSPSDGALPRDARATAYEGFLQAPVALMVVAPDGTVVIANRAATDLVGDGADTLAGMSVDVLLGSPAVVADRRHDRSADDPSVDGSSVQHEVTRADGTALVVDVGVRPMADGLRCVALSDTTAQRASADELERLANEDALTGLYNRRGFHRHLDRHLAEGRRGRDRFALIVFDIDRFKAINDTHGHLVGDEILREVARTLRARIRVEDALARVGGDEFVLYLAQSDRAQSTGVAEEIRSSIEQCVLLDAVRRPVPVTVSVGLALYPDDGPWLSDLLASADARLYAAKAAGRNAVASQ